MKELLELFKKIRAQQNPPKDEAILQELSNYHDSFLSKHYDELKTEPDDKNEWLQKTKAIGFANTFKQIMNEKDREATLKHFSDLFYKEVSILQEEGAPL